MANPSQFAASLWQRTGLSRFVRPTAAPRSDEELLLAYRDRGDQDAFVELVSRYEREMYSYLRRYLADAEAAEDAFQTTFLQVHLKCDQYEEGRPVRPWLYTIATHQAIDSQRRGKRHKAASLNRTSRNSEDDSWSLADDVKSHEEAPEEALYQDERRMIVRQAVESLPEIQREVLTLVYYQGMKYREAADILAIPVGTVKSRLHAALVKLQENFPDLFNTEI